MAEREYVSKLEHHSNHLHRLVKAGEAVLLPEEEAARNRHLYEPKVSKSGKPSLEDLINRALQMNLGKEEDIKKMPYEQLAALVKKGE